MDETRDDLTPQEEAQMTDTGETPAEAHRAGEFDDLRGMLSDITGKLDSMTSAIDALRSAVQDSAAVKVEDGAVIADDSEDPDVTDALDLGLDDLDLTIEE